MVAPLAHRPILKNRHRFVPTPLFEGLGHRLPGLVRRTERARDRLRIDFVAPAARRPSHPAGEPPAPQGVGPALRTGHPSNLRQQTEPRAEPTWPAFSSSHVQTWSMLRSND